VSVEYRTIEPDEFEEFLEVDRIGFGHAPPKPEHPDTWARGEIERTRAAFEDGRIVGVGRNYSFEVTVPGGALLPAGAVSWISVLPTHRRRGVLTGTMAALHDDARERGEAVSILTASESLIYGRFGYGIATWRMGLSFDRAYAQFVHELDDPGRVRYLSADEALKVFPPVYDAARRLRAGGVPRPDFWWPESSAWLDEEFSPTFRAVHEGPDGSVDGFALYGLSSDWNDGIPAKRLHVVDLISLNQQARTALWHFLVGVDLVRTVVASTMPVDEPLRWMLRDSRRVGVDYINDGMWVCVHDEERALASRTYSTEATVVLDVHRVDGSRGRFEIDGGPDGAQCRPTKAAADVVLGQQQLGAVYLGGISFHELLAAGLVEEATAGAIERADRMFATQPPPTMSSWF
jgi:predicted acetyltransferase